MNPLYTSWLTDFLPGPLPEEKRSTCGDCVMCAPGSHIAFDVKVKCCSYIPTIPNFLAGKILKQKIEVFEAYLSRADIRPQGVYPHNDFVVNYNSNSPLFGQNSEWRCPYYLDEGGGKCGIWQNRNSLCATWFCKYLRGHISRKFWTELDELFSTVEKCLSNWCLRRLEAGSLEFREAFPGEIQELSFRLWLKQQDFSMQASPQTKWGKWLGREKDFFYECDSLVSPLSWTQVRKICGPGIHPLEEKVLNAYSSIHSGHFPDVLHITSVQLTEKNDEEFLVWMDTPYDPVNIQKSDLRLLHRMNGLKMEEVLQHIPKELLMRLFDAGVIL
jgi:hypothetical protein